MEPRVRYKTLVSDNARWDGFAFRPGDIVISTPAKCGTTWMQMICALLDAEGLRRYEARAAQLAEPDLVAWVHHRTS